MEQMDRVIFSERLREAMGDMQVVDLAEKLGCNKSVVSLYLSRQRVPSKMAIQLMSLVLGVNPAWLYGLDVPKRSNAKIITTDKTPPLTDDQKRLMDIVPTLPGDVVRAVLALVSQAAQNKETEEIKT